MAAQVVDRVIQEFAFTGKHAQLMRYFARTHTPSEIAQFAECIARIEPRTAQMVLRDLQHAAKYGPPDDDDQPFSLLVEIELHDGA